MQCIMDIIFAVDNMESNVVYYSIFWWLGAILEWVGGYFGYSGGYFGWEIIDVQMEYVSHKQLFIIDKSDKISIDIRLLSFSFI